MNKFRNCFLVVLVGYCFFSVGVLCAQHPAWHHYTVNDGLPSNGVFALMQDSRGFLWVGASNGICKFNGYEFVPPTDTSGTSAASVCHIVEDAKGRIWFNHVNGSLWFVENDTIRAWTHNKQIKPFVKKYGITLRFAFDETGSVWIGSSRGGILVVKPDGTQTVISGQARNAVYFSKVFNQYISAEEINPLNSAEIENSRKLGQTSEVFHWQDGELRSLGPFPLDYSPALNGGIGFGFWPIQGAQNIAVCLHTYYIIQDDQLVWSGQKEMEGKAILKDSEGNILLANPMEPNAGLLRFRSIDHFKRNEFDNLLPGKSAVQIVLDREGGYWVATRDAGIFYCKNPKLGIYDQTDGLPAPEVLSLSTDGRTKIYAGLRQLDVAEFKLNEPRPRILPRPPISEMQVLRFDTLTGRLWAANNLCFLEHDLWRFARWLNPTGGSNQQIPIKKISPGQSGAQWWASSHAGVFCIDTKAGTGNRISLDTIPSLRTYSVKEDSDGTLWIASTNGLLFLRDGHIIPPLFTYPNQRFNTIIIETLPQSVGGGNIMALTGGGLLIRDQKGQFTHLTRQNGLTDDLITELEISPEGVIYGCSDAGLNILRKQSDGQWRIEALSIKHGLPSNQVNDVALIGGETWVATDKGIARFKAKPAPAPMPIPILEKFVVNNNPSVFFNNLQLPHDQNNLSLRFFALHFRSGGDIPYRYRLFGADTTFIYTRTREVNFAHLPSGHYTFEVQAQNENGRWSESARWPFAILPPWWATWWFRALAGASLVVALYLFYQNRLQSIRREAAEREKIRDLETAALRAQMNPHFIFNCLQAIQSFIAKNDRDAAATYLARFAKLVRLALHGSVDGLHTLTEEIAMLENYLHLEQLRFRGNFEFTVRTEEGIAPSEISLPPLLVQPFVENALIHGLQGRESGGLVEVVFALKGNLLEVSVTDNGLGFSEKSNPGKTAHKSVGMMLTQKRLDLLMGVGKAGVENLARETVLDSDGTPLGARVQILVPI